MSKRHTYWYDVGFHNRKAKVCMDCFNDNKNHCNRPYKWIPKNYDTMDNEDYDAYHEGYMNKDARNNMKCK